MKHPSSPVLVAVAASGLLLGSSAARAANLCRNADFEQSFAGAGPADHWTNTSLARGATGGRAVAEGLASGACHRLRVPADAPIVFNITRQQVRGLHSGDQGVVSAWVRTTDVRGGAGAYIGVNFFDGNGERISWVDADKFQTGTTDWTRLTKAFVVPSGCVRLEMNLVLHGHGTAWFDRAQVERGATPTAFVSPATVASDGGAGRGRVAILRDPMPSTGAAADPNRIAATARRAGYRCTFVSCDDLAREAVLTRSRFDVLVLTRGSSFPALAAENLRAFLSDGGSLISSGGYPLDRLMVRTSQGWRAASETEADTQSMRPLSEAGPGSSHWTVGGRDMPQRSAIEGRTGDVAWVEVSTPRMPGGGWITLASPPLTGLPADSRALAFRAQSTAGEVPLALEVAERDGARWRTVVRVGTVMRAYEVDLRRLEYWKDNPSVGRGGPGDRLRIADAVGIRFGITTEFVRPDQPYGLRVSGVWTSPSAPPAWKLERLNSATGGVNPATFLVPDPAAISICDAGAPLSRVAHIVPRTGQGLTPGVVMMRAEGCSATGQTAHGEPGAPLKARWEPLADARDRYGRLRGTAFAVMWNFAGDYPGSVWAYTGISNRSILTDGGAPGERLLLGALQRATSGAFLYDAQADPPCVRPGEVLTVRARAGSVAQLGRLARVRLLMLSAGKPLDSRTSAVRLPGRGSAEVRFRLRAPQRSSGGPLVLRLTLETPGAPTNTIECGAAVWDTQRQARGARIAYRDSVLDRGRGPEFLLGSQIAWGNASVTATDPLRWWRQLRAMRDQGIAIARCFMNIPGRSTDALWRLRDAMVQLAQEAGVNLFYEGLSDATADPEETARRAAHGRKAAERYRAARGLFFDIRNEPTISVAQVGPHTAREMADRMRVWARDIRSAVVDVDPTRLVTVGHLQGFGWQGVTYDPIAGSLDMDFANRHYYGALAGYAPELKQIDLRSIGKAPSTGEFGCTSRPGLKSHMVYETETEARVRYSYVPHACVGLGGLFAANWHWQDPIEDVFPCGLFLSDGAARDRLQPFRNSGALFRSIRPCYVPPPVWLVVPADRFGPDKAGIEGDLARVARLLIGLHVESGTVREEDVERLPVEARCLVWPGAALPPVRVGSRGLPLYVVQSEASDVEVRAALVRFVEGLGVRRHRLTPDLPEIESHRVAGASGAVAHVLFNTSRRAVPVAIRDLPTDASVLVGPQSGGLIVFDGSGRLVAAEGVEVSLGGAVLWKGDTTLGAVSLDGSDLRQAGQRLLLPFGSGKVRLFRGGRVSVGEVVGGRWREWEIAVAGNGTLTLDADRAASWLVLAPSNQFAQACARAARW